MNETDMLQRRVDRLKAALARFLTTEVEYGDTDHDRLYGLVVALMEEQVRLVMVEGGKDRFLNQARIDIGGACCIYGIIARGCFEKF